MDIPLPLPEPAPAPAPKEPTRQVVIALAIVTLAILAAAFWNRPKAEPAPVPAVQIQNSAPASAPVIASDASSVFLAPDTFSGRDHAQRFINESQGKQKGSVDYEMLVTGIVPDLADANLFYFATASVGAASKGRFVGVYRYNTKTAAWHRLYKTTFPLENKSTSILRVLGLADGNLILSRDVFDRKPETCESLWLVGDLVTMSLNKPLDGLKPYSLQDDIRKGEEQKVKTCQD